MHDCCSDLIGGGCFSCHNGPSLDFHLFLPTAFFPVPLVLDRPFSDKGREREREREERDGGGRSDRDRGGGRDRLRPDDHDQGKAQRGWTQ